MFNNYDLKDKCEKTWKFKPQLADQTKHDLAVYFNGVDDLNLMIDWLSPNNADRRGDLLRQFVPKISDEFIRAHAAYMISCLIEECKTLS